MQLDTQKKKIIAIAAAVGFVLLGGIVTIYTIKQQTKNNTSHQQPNTTTDQAKQLDAASNTEKTADKLFNDGDITGAKSKYQAAAMLYAQAKNQDGEERVRMQISLIDTRQENTSPETTDLSDTPVDRKLDKTLGTPTPIE